MLSREDFAARVKDKSDKEVATLVGKPAAVDASQPDRVAWIYNSRTFNIEEGNKFDTKAEFHPATGLEHISAAAACVPCRTYPYFK